MDSDLKNDAQDLLIRYGGDAFPNLFRSAKGSIVIDSNGREILDFTSGQMCATLGHNHPAITRAIKESCDTALHMFSGMIPEPVVKLAKALADWLPSPLRKSLLLSTGSESNEAALRLAKLATGGYEVIALGGSWHGTTGGSAAATFASDRRGYGPKVPGNHMIPEPNAYRCPIDHCRDSCDMSCLNVGLKMFDMASDGAPAAIIAEPVISAGGVIVPPAGYFDCLRDAAQRRRSAAFDSDRAERQRSDRAVKRPTATPLLCGIQWFDLYTSVRLISYPKIVLHLLIQPTLWRSIESLR